MRDTPTVFFDVAMIRYVNNRCDDADVWFDHSSQLTVFDKGAAWRASLLHQPSIDYSVCLTYFLAALPLLIEVRARFDGAAAEHGCWWARLLMMFDGSARFRSAGCFVIAHNSRLIASMDWLGEPHKWVFWHLFDIEHQPVEGPLCFYCNFSPELLLHLTSTFFIICKSTDNQHRTMAFDLVRLLMQSLFLMNSSNILTLSHTQYRKPKRKVNTTLEAKSPGPSWRCWRISTSWPRSGLGIMLSSLVSGLLQTCIAWNRINGFSNMSICAQYGRSRWCLC